MKYGFIAGFIFSLLALRAEAQVKITKVDDWTDNSRTGGGIAVNPRNPINMVSVVSGGIAYYTLDGGGSWQKTQLPTTDKTIAQPLVKVDSKGDFYYLSIIQQTTGSQLLCHVSRDGGKSWDEGNIVVPAGQKQLRNFSAMIDDKELYVQWAETENADNAAESKTYVYQTNSSGGKKWSKPVLIYQQEAASQNIVNVAPPAKGPDGKMFASWYDGQKVFLDRSFNGSLWLSMDMTITTRRSNDPSIYGGRVFLDVDKSKMHHRGSLYSVWSDQRSPNDQRGVWFMRSANFGDNWTTPMRISSEKEESAQYQPALTVDPLTGYLYIFYFDSSEEGQVDMYISQSKDGGASFKSTRINETTFASADDSGISVVKGSVSCTWTTTADGKTTLWVATFPPAKDK